MVSARHSPGERSGKGALRRVTHHQRPCRGVPGSAGFRDAPRNRHVGQRRCAHHHRRHRQALAVAKSPFFADGAYRPRRAGWTRPHPAISSSRSSAAPTRSGPASSDHPSPGGAANLWRDGPPAPPRPRTPGVGTRRRCVITADREAGPLLDAKRPRRAAPEAAPPGRRATRLNIALQAARSCGFNAMFPVARGDYGQLPALVIAVTVIGPGPGARGDRAARQWSRPAPQPRPETAATLIAGGIEVTLRRIGFGLLGLVALLVAGAWLARLAARPRPIAVPSPLPRIEAALDPEGKARIRSARRTSPGAAGAPAASRPSSCDLSDLRGSGRRRPALAGSAPTARIGLRPGPPVAPARPSRASWRSTVHASRCSATGRRRLLSPASARSPGAVFRPPSSLAAIARPPEGSPLAGLDRLEITDVQVRCATRNSAATGCWRTCP